MSLKVVVAGPKGTGKSIVANFLAGQSDKLDIDRYDPTAGARILEMEKPMGNSNLKVEIWDSSGDHQYESCWRAVMSEADGVVLLYNPDAPSQDQQIHDWFDFFVKKNGLSDQQCMIFAHRSKDSTGDRFKPPPLFSRVTAALTTKASGGDMRSMFDNFLKEIYNIKRRS
jgi:intraflagellar transport protein 22